MAEPFYQGITEFIFVEDKPEKADIIFIPGSLNMELADRAAALYHEGYAPCILPSGRGSILKESLPGQGQTEWDKLRSRLLMLGVPSSAVLKEDRATFTWENAKYSRKVCDEQKISVKKAILCPQAFHARRALTYYRQQFPETEFLVCPAETAGISRENWFLSKEGTRRVLGELVRCGEQFGCMIPPGDPAGMFCEDIAAKKMPDMEF